VNVDLLIKAFVALCVFDAFAVAAWYCIVRRAEVRCDVPRCHRAATHGYRGEAGEYLLCPRHSWTDAARGAA
jgi:hypothetical protein